MTFDFANQVVVITGAAGNLGEAVAKSFQQTGAKLVLVDRSPDRLQSMFPDLAGSSDCYLAHSVDVTDQNSVAGMVNETLKRFGRVDVLVNIAGGYRGGIPLHETPVETWDFLMNLNAKSVFISSRAVIPQMLKQGTGKIVSIASRAALGGEAGAAVYSASKAAIVRLTESMAAELKDRGINVNCVLPGLIDTPPNRQAMPDANHSSWVQPAYLAHIILFLCSNLSAAINGAAIQAYGRS
jgi:NAD(P)-dependent dehydrogenase (short-subunit alcohol dehydrogenase family)